MRVLLTTLNSKYVHSNLALKYLYLLTASLGIAGAFVRTFQIPVNTGFLVAGLVLICLVNMISKKVSEISLW